MKKKKKLYSNIFTKNQVKNIPWNSRTQSTLKTRMRELQLCYFNGRSGGLKMWSP